MPGTVLTYDLIKHALKGLHSNRSMKPQIYFLEEQQMGEGSKLFLLIKKVKDTNSESFKMGVLYKFGGHTTPVVIEKIILDEDGPEVIKEEIHVFCTDSRAFDVEDGEGLREQILGLTRLGLNVIIHSVGLDQTNILETVRQHDQGSCPIFSLIDLELLLRRSDLLSYFSSYSENYKLPNAFNIKSLPPHLMFYIQSVGGLKSYGRIERVGLKDYLETNPVLGDVMIGFEHYGITFTDLLGTNLHKTILDSLCRSKTPRSMLNQLSSEIGEDSDEEKPDDNYPPIIAQTNDSIITLNHLLSWLNKEKQPNFMVDIFACIYRKLAESNFDCKEILNYDADALKDEDIFNLARQQYEFSSDETPILHQTKKCLSKRLQEALIALFSTHVLPDELLMGRVLEGRPLSSGLSTTPPPIRPPSDERSDLGSTSPPLLSFFKLGRMDKLDEFLDESCRFG